MFIVSGEDEVSKSKDRQMNNTRENEIKEQHSRQNSKDYSSNRLTRDGENSEYVKSEDEQKHEPDERHPHMKLSSTFTAAIRSVNFSSKEVSAGDNSNNNTVSEL